MTEQLRKAALLPFLLALAGQPLPALAAPDALEREPRLDAQPTDASPAPLAEPAQPSVIGPYRVLHELGSGGMGSVHLAESTDNAGQHVALKLMRSDSFSPALLAQFDVEQRALASASHDSIARFIGSGATTDGRPWIAMEWVEGQPITAYCDARRLDVDARLALLGEVCDAVQHLHERGIIHGDLKPSNILVTERDGRARPKLIDLGLARLRADAPDLDTPVMGTPAYMAPEQFDLAEPLRDERSDVFALGRVLRELLVGEPHATSAARAGLGPILLASRAPELPLRAHFDRLGAATDSVARRRGTRARALRRRLDRTLDGIAQRATEARRERRFSGPRELAMALREHLRDRARRADLARDVLLVGAVSTLAFACGVLFASS